MFAVRISPGGPTAAPDAQPASDDSATPNTVTAFVRFEFRLPCDMVEVSVRTLDRYLRRRGSPNVRFGSKADIEAASPDVRFTPKSRHSLTGLARPLCAKSGSRRFLFDRLSVRATTATGISASRGVMHRGIYDALHQNG